MGCSDRRSPRRAAGFTLVELVIASTITVLVSVAAVLTLNGVTAAKGRAERQYDVQQEARVAVDAIATALRNAFRPADPDDTDLQLLLGEDGWRGDGDELPSDRIRFFTVSRRTIRADQPESDVREVEFGILDPPDAEEGQQPALMRRIDPTRNPEPDGGGVLERLSDRVIGLNITYHDGAMWLDEWLEGQGWPHAVRIQLLVSPTAPTPASSAPGSSRPFGSAAGGGAAPSPGVSGDTSVIPYMVSRTINFPHWAREIESFGGFEATDEQQQPQQQGDNE